MWIAHVRVGRLAVAPLTMATLLAGCGNESERVTRVAQQALHEQSKQNQEMVRLNREVAASTQRLVEADAHARGDVLAAQRDIQTQQSAVNQQRDSLESERKDIARQRRTESVLAPILLTLGTALLCLLPVAVACFVLRQADRTDPPEFAQMLVEDLVADKPMLLPPPSAPPPSSQPRLQGPPGDPPF
jgi:ABC-type transporter Mla subunit MlaD